MNLGNLFLTLQAEKRRTAMAVYDGKVELLHLIYIGNRQVSDKGDTQAWGMKAWQTEE